MPQSYPLFRGFFCFGKKKMLTRARIIIIVVMLQGEITMEESAKVKQLKEWLRNGIDFFEENIEKYPNNAELYLTRVDSFKSVLFKIYELDDEI